VNLIGRRSELAEVKRLLDRSVAGVGGYLVVTGPSGAGKTALVDAAADLAESRGIQVLRTHRDLELTVEELAHSGPQLLIIDDLDTADAPAMAFPALLASRLDSGGTALLVTAQSPIGFGPHVRLRSLSEPELATLLPDLPADAVHAVWLGSGGWPGTALELADALTSLKALDQDTGDAVAHLALTLPSRAQFLDLDVGLLRLLEAAVGSALPPMTRARALARLARELLGDASGAARRRTLIDEAESLARETADPGVIAEILDCRLHALWDPAAAEDRLSTASEIVEQARRAGDAMLEGRGLFWRFIALTELGDLTAAEAALAAYARAGELADDAEAAVVVLARQSMLATVRGRFDAAAELAAQVAVRAREVGLADTDRLIGTLRAAIAAQHGEFDSLVEPFQDLARRLPGHFYEANAARALAESGRHGEAGLELERILPTVLTGSGPRWLGAMADLAIVAALGDHPTAAAQSLYDGLLPYQGRLVVWGGANTIMGPVDDCLGRLAAHLSRTDHAVSHFDAAVEVEERAGTLPWLASTLLARAGALSARANAGDRSRAQDDVDRARLIAQRLGMKGILAALDVPSDGWRLTRDGTDWILEAGPETTRLRDARGLRYLRALLAAPGQEIAALDLVAEGAGLGSVPAGDSILDETARDAYHARLASLDEQLDAMDRAGDAERAAAIHAERRAVLAELKRASGVGGRPRLHSNEAERARVNATRALWAAVTRVEAAAPLAGAHLRSSLRSGSFLRYQPTPGGPARWHV